MKVFASRLAVIVTALTLSACTTVSTAPKVAAVETWEKLDRKLKSEIFELNVCMKIRLKDGSWAQLADASPRNKYPVFNAVKEDRGYRVIGYGSAFPIKTLAHDKTYFVTGRHVVESADQIIKECERFYAAMRFTAEQSSPDNPEGKYKELLQIVALSAKHDLTPQERALYGSTVDGIWDTYDRYLGIKADPARIMFNKYFKQVGMEKQLGYFLHAPGPATQQALEAKVFKAGTGENDPDIAILSTAANATLGLEFDSIAPSEGQEIQVIGYPSASEAIDLDASKYYSPTFNSGRISRVAPRLLQVDAPVATGNSGGPVVSLRGKVLGVVARRAVTREGTELPNFCGAITASAVQSFAPELFGKSAK